MYQHILQEMEYFISPLKTNKCILTSSSLCLLKTLICKMTKETITRKKCHQNYPEVNI